MAAIGYGFGGIGAVNLALAGHGGARGVPTALLGVVSHHGGVAPGHRIAAESAASRPKLLLESGGKADSNADIATLLDELEGVGASYEVWRPGARGSVRITQGCIGRGEVPPPPLPRGAQPTPGHCLPDGKCQLQWHL